MANLEGIDESLFLFGVDSWMLLRVVEDEKVPEDGLGKCQLTIDIFVHNLMKTNG